VSASFISFEFDCFWKAFLGKIEGVPKLAGLLLGDIFCGPRFPAD